MKAYKVHGTIDETGRLIVTEAIALHPGEVEVILLQSPNNSLETDPSGVSTPNPHNGLNTDSDVETVIPGLKQWLADSPPVPTNYDPDQAKREYLQEKHNL
ncbi:MAG: hypothetical protein AB4042_16220 [Leptolyngbyaceae cyanobacterium]